MKILEQFALSKTGRTNDCEDLIVFSPDFAAIIDGATARNQQLYDGRTPGLTAAILVKEAIESLDGRATLRNTLDKVTAHFLSFYGNRGIQAEAHDQILTASAVIYSRYYNQIWMVGDCQCLFNDQVYTHPNGIDDFMAGVRSFINQAELLKGKTIDWIMNNDPGGSYIKELLVDQFLFQNHGPSVQGAYQYTAFDGRPIREESVKILQLDSSVEELILASDGYPVLYPSLQQSETKLAELLARDPLCIFENKGVKGLKSGFVSFDDRSFLKMTL